MRRPFLLAFLALIAGCQRGPASSSDPHVLRWGGDAEGGAPFVEADPADPSRVRGFDVDIATMIAQGLGRRPQFVQVAWASIEQSVERGDFDIGMSGIEDRPELRARHAVSVPYFEFREVLAVRPSDSARFRSLADLARHRVGTLGATGAYRLLLEARARSGVVPVSYDDDVHPYEDLVAGRLDAVLLAHVIARRSLRRTGGFVIQPQPVATGHYVVLLPHDRTALRDSVNAILLARMRDGSLEKTFRAWDSWDDAEAAYFARALALDPQLLLMDEPTAALDPPRRDALGRSLRALAEEGRGLLVATHDLEFARRWADRVVVLRQGRTAPL